MGEAKESKVSIVSTKAPQDSYVVRGAKIHCSNGSKSNVINLPIDHGAYVGEQPLITVKDSKTKNIGTFGICSKTQKPCKPDVKSWLNGNKQKKIFDMNTMNMEETVVEPGSYGVCSRQSGLIEFDNSGQLLIPESGWKRYQNKIIFMSNRRPGTLIGEWSDLTCNDIEKDDLLELHPYFRYQEKESVDMLFEEFRTMVNNFSWADTNMQSVVNKMVDHFRKGNGIDFYNDTLTGHVRNHKETIQYKETIEKILKYELIKEKGEFNKLSMDEIKLYIQNKADYPAYEKGDVFSGLFIAIHGMWGNNVILKSYKLKDKYYKGILRFEFFDHFGLGGEDMMNTKRRGGILIPDLAGMRAWFTLQHYKKFEGKFKPFTNYEIVEYEFEGDLDERQYDIVEEELKGIREKIMKKESK
ncbi:MAG: DUF3289 family protein [Hungatella sp.]|nr:DUF3289 family protein [Hungatella sp.]